MALSRDFGSPSAPHPPSADVVYHHGFGGVTYSIYAIFFMIFTWCFIYMYNDGPGLHMDSITRFLKERQKILLRFWNCVRDHHLSAAFVSGLCRVSKGYRRTKSRQSGTGLSGLTVERLLGVEGAAWASRSKGTTDKGIWSSCTAKKTLVIVH